jgi:hypothetical protein
MKSTVHAVRLTVVVGIVAAACSALPVAADTTNVKTQSWVYVKKTGAHCKDDPNCVNRYHPAIKPAARARHACLIAEALSQGEAPLSLPDKNSPLPAIPGRWRCEIPPNE